MRQTRMPSFSAKLLFQFRVVRNGRSPRRRLCEERIVSFDARNAASALSRAKEIGRAAQTDYKSAADGHVYFEFLGIIELIDMTIYRDTGEVWYQLVERLDPQKRLSKLLVPENDLHAVRTDLPIRKRTPRL